MSEKFKACYEVDDGYCGGARPKYFTIESDEIEDDMTEDDLRDLYDQCMRDAFDQQISPYGKNEDEFVVWAKGQQNRDNDDDQKP